MSQVNGTLAFLSTPITCQVTWVTDNCLIIWETDWGYCECCMLKNTFNLQFHRPVLLNMGRMVQICQRSPLAAQLLLGVNDSPIKGRHFQSPGNQHAHRMCREHWRQRCVELEADLWSYGSPAIAHKRAKHLALKLIDWINLQLVRHKLYCTT